MTAICPYFQVHQPVRLRRVRAIGPHPGLDYWDDATNRTILERAARKCYLPTNQVLLDLIRETDGWFRCAFSISGTLIEQARRFNPAIIDSFRRLVDTGHVEIMGETYYHSLSGLWEDGREFQDQVHAHRGLMRETFGVEPTTFRNTELIYDDRIASRVRALGFKAMVTEGADRILAGRSPNHVYAPAHEHDGLRLLLKNYRLSDDVAFRFSNHQWEGFPLTAPKYAQWLADTPGQTLNLFMDYETFGEHQWPETGIFDFLRHLPREVRKHPHLGFALPREVAAQNPPVDTIQVPWAISWADTERDVSAWLHNAMQQHSFGELKALREPVLATGDGDLLHTWRLLQTSDHLYYCSTKQWGDQDIHAYFSPYESPYLAFVNHQNAIADLKAKVLARQAVHQPSEPMPAAKAVAAPPVAATIAAVPARRALPGRAPLIWRTRSVRQPRAAPTSGRARRRDEHERQLPQPSQQPERRQGPPVLRA